MAAVTPPRAAQLFDMVAARVCCPCTVPAPCIPFDYPDDGCWGRAHEMCRLMIAVGEAPAKVWIYGNLHVSSANKPNCNVTWGWHVAPTLQVGVGGGIETWVIDPSLFAQPVPQATWVGVQGAPNAAVEPSDASVFHRSQGGSWIETDPSYTKTAQVLADYRTDLRLRSAGPDGPPPYPNCLSPAAGRQWIGTIAAGATLRWFTWAWPANRQVFWTIMPLTQCPGGPQLTWDVQVERASAGECTYWITVHNLTNDTVRFEGRYDLLV